MHNIAEGFGSETNPEFTRFLRYANRSCTEVQSQLYVALDQRYITEIEFKKVYGQAGRTRAAIRGRIKYLVTHEQNRKNESLKKNLNPSPPELTTKNQKPAPTTRNEELRTRNQEQPRTKNPEPRTGS